MFLNPVYLTKLSKPMRGMVGGIWFRSKMVPEQNPREGWREYFRNFWILNHPFGHHWYKWIAFNFLCHWRQLQIALAFGVIPFIPSSNMFFSVGFVVAERALFLPSIGYVLLLITAIISLEQRFQTFSKVMQKLFKF